MFAVFNEPMPKDGCLIDQQIFGSGKLVYSISTIRKLEGNPWAPHFLNLNLNFAMTVTAFL